MAYEPKEGDIAIYKVKEKTNEKGPDYTGRLMINGAMKDVSLWRKTDTMLAGVVKEPWKKTETTHVAKSAPKEFDDSEIPF